MIGFAVVIAIGFLAGYFRLFIDKSTSKKFRHWEYTKMATPPEINETDTIYHGRKNSILFEEAHDILLKYCVYFKTLEPGLKQLFIERLLSFMERKIFIIKDDEGFKEMPVLVSAAAVQLTFGLRDFMLPFYKYIQIYPQEYFADDSFRILAGNVENNTITIAWNHLLQGNRDATDGSHIGLHEMSHALYVQKMVIEADADQAFGKVYKKLLSECHEAHRYETKGMIDFYSHYAESDMQEFWAESCELFFEKPVQFCEHYPDLYVALKTLLNQDPQNMESPIVRLHLSFREKIYNFLGNNKA